MRGQLPVGPQAPLYVPTFSQITITFQRLMKQVKQRKCTVSAATRLYLDFQARKAGDVAIGVTGQVGAGHMARSRESSARLFPQSLP